MGRSATKLTTSGCRSVDLAKLRGTSGLWSWSLAGEPLGSVAWRLSGDELELRWGQRTQYVRLRRTAQHFGGEREWLACPYCSRKCRVIYLVNGQWACRRCFRLGYQSQRESAGTRAQAKADKILRTLGGSLWEDGDPPKPKRMRWSTYWGRIERARELDNLSAFAVLGRLGIADG